MLNDVLTVISSRARPYRVYAAIVALSLAAAILSSAWPVMGQGADEGVPAKPVGLTGTVASGAVSLSWDDPGDASITGYQVLRRNPVVDEPGEFHTIIDDNGAADTSYNDTTVSGGTRYVYRVRAAQLCGPEPHERLLQGRCPGSRP